MSSQFSYFTHTYFEKLPEFLFFSSLATIKLGILNQYIFTKVFKHSLSFLMPIKTKKIMKPLKREAKIK